MVLNLLGNLITPPPRAPKLDAENAKAQVQSREKIEKDWGCLVDGSELAAEEKLLALVLVCSFLLGRFWTRLYAQAVRERPMVV